MNKERFKSYSHVIALSLVDYFDRYYHLQDDPYLETREREERFVDQIVAAVEGTLEKTLPVFLAGCLARLSQVSPTSSQMEASAAQTIQQELPDVDVDEELLKKAAK